MEEAHSVNSPRRVLSFSKRKKQQPAFQDSDSIRSSPLRASQVHEPKPSGSEVYGFVGSISTVVATLIFLIWAYVPDKLLESIGIHYHPIKYWVLAMPTYLMVTLLLLLVLAFYIGLNFTDTPHPTSLNTLFDEYSREPGEFDPEEGNERPVGPISDIAITRVCDVMFNASDAK